MPVKPSRRTALKTPSKPAVRRSVGRAAGARHDETAKPPAAKRAYRNEARTAAAEQTGERIVAAARTLLIGGANLPVFSLDGVAKQAGVTRLTVYNRFASKQGLLEAVFDDIAQRGGLFAGLPAVFDEPDPRLALRRAVAVFCRFWSQHGTLLPKFGAVAKLDDEIAASLRQRTERRRHTMSALAARLMPADDARFGDLVDVLFALTAFEMYDALAVRGRSAQAIEALIATLVEQAVEGYGSRHGAR